MRWYRRPSRKVLRVRNAILRRKLAVRMTVAVDTPQGWATVVDMTLNELADAVLHGQGSPLSGGWSAGPVPTAITFSSPDEERWTLADGSGSDE
jgi:hypothetical protein